jgi:tripartite-type tricarboxylate transporter receptor subunit TctC
MSRFRAALLALLAATFVSAISAQAQDYPSQTIKLIVPFTPGGPVDALGRVIAKRLETQLGQTIVIENKPGGGTTLGAKMTAAATPDGYTLLLIGPNLAYYPVLFPKLDFDPEKSLVPVATLVTWSHVFSVAPSLPVKTAAELVSYAKANPGKVAFGYGLATMPHILGEAFIRQTGVDIVRVPYRGGSQARADLLGGRIQFNIAPVPQLLPLIRDKKIRAIAYTAMKRDPDMPDVPTMTESGFPQIGYHPDVWMGILAPAGTPAAIVSKLNKEVNAVLKSDEMKPVFRRYAYDAFVSTPDEFAKFFASQMKKWPPVLRSVGLQAQ